MIFRFLLCFYLMGFYGSNAKSYDEIKTWFIEQGADCIKEFPIESNDMLLLEQQKIPENKEARCWLGCIFKKTVELLLAAKGVDSIDNKGMFDVATSTAMFDKDHSGDQTKQENSKKLMEICKKVNDEAVSDGEKGCERSVLLYKCFIEHAPGMGFPLT